VLQILFYVCFLAALVVAFMRFRKLAAMPMHIRWELYPTAHAEGPMGGSYLENVDWSTSKPRLANMIERGMAFGREISLFERIFENNRGLWFSTWPMHMGLFAAIVGVVIMALEALAGIIFPGFILPTWLVVVSAIILAGGSLLGVLGAIGVFIRRMTNSNLKLYAAPIDFLNLLFIMAVGTTGLISWAVYDRSFDQVRAYITNLFTANFAAAGNPVLAVNLVLVSLFVLYLPFTKMLHTINKYFMWDKIVWDDEPTIGKINDKRLPPLLQQEMTWSAPHIGKGKWIDIVSSTGVNKK
jgi:nitrate reductase gamma subunit